MGGAVPDDPKPDETASGITEDKVHEIVNSALAAREKRFTKSIIDEVSGLLDERLSEEPEPRGGKDKGGAEPEGNGADKRLAALEKELADTKARELSARKREALRSALKEVRVEGLSDFTVRGILSDIEESGGEFFVGDKPIGQWAKDFARTDEGKRYIPAKARGGTNAKPGGIDFEPNHKPGSLAEWEQKTNHELFDALRGAEH